MVKNVSCGKDTEPVQLQEMNDLRAREFKKEARTLDRVIASVDDDVYDAEEKEHAELLRQLRTDALKSFAVVRRRGQEIGKTRRALRLETILAAKFDSIPKGEDRRGGKKLCLVVWEGNNFFLLWVVCVLYTVYSRPGPG